MNVNSRYPVHPVHKNLLSHIPPYVSAKVATKCRRPAIELGGTEKWQSCMTKGHWVPGSLVKITSAWARNPFLQCSLPELCWAFSTAADISSGFQPCSICPVFHINCLPLDFTIIVAMMFLSSPSSLYLLYFSWSYLTTTWHMTYWFSSFSHVSHRKLSPLNE